jgi:hypothetical protein
MAAIATPEQIAQSKCIASMPMDIDSISARQSETGKKKFFFHSLNMISSSSCSYFTIGKAKDSIILSELVSRPECLHNQNVYNYLSKIGWSKWTKQGTWANNYTSQRSREIFDCHFISYNIVCDGIVFHTEILFMSLKCGEILVPSVIISDGQIITIIRNHIMIINNLLSTVNHNYRIELMCKALATKVVLDLRYIGHPACKTKLYTYQRGSIQWMINLESALPEIEFCQNKIFDLGDTLKLYFNYDASNNLDKCFIKYGELPKVLVKGGIIADENGLGKTVQALSLSISRSNIRTLIIVPNHLKEHWLFEMEKHFDTDIFIDLVDIKTVNECNQMSDVSLEKYKNGRLIVDELAELYAMARVENHMLFNRLCSFNFQFRWGISPTPFVDDCALFNIIKFLLGNSNNKDYKEKIGNYIMIQEAFKPFFRRNIKDNVQADIQLPEVHIHNIGLTFSKHEQSIIDAITSDSHYSVDEMLRIISNAMLELSNNEKSVITVEELKRYTVQRFLEKVAIANEQVQNIEIALQNVCEKILQYKEKITSHTKNSDSHSCSDQSWISAIAQNNTILRELEERKHHITAELVGAKHILERRKTVHQNYLEITENISDILQKATNGDANGDTNTDESMDDDKEIDTDKMCPICYQAFTSDTVVLFMKCRHLFCQPCFECCHKLRPNTCPMCRTIAEVGEINYIGLNNKMITCTKNTEILRLLNSKLASERFIIFTRFDKFIPSLVAFLSANDISSLAFDDYRQAPAVIQNDCRVILLSANTNASGTDMSYIHNAIIIEPFDNYIYGKEIEKQLIGRLHRINQTHAVDVYRLYIRNTIEEEIYALG